MFRMVFFLKLHIFLFVFFCFRAFPNFSVFFSFLFLILSLIWIHLIFPPYKSYAYTPHIHTQPPPMMERRFPPLLPPLNHPSFFFHFTKWAVPTLYFFSPSFFFVRPLCGFEIVELEGERGR